MVAHSALTGSNLHEPKGVSSASANTAYVANGSGSGTWKKIDSNAIDQTSVKNINKEYLKTYLPSVGAVGLTLIPITQNCTLTKVTGVLSAALATADVVITVLKNGSSTAGTATVLFTGSAKGNTYTITPSSNNTFVSGDYIQISSGGGGSGTVDMHFLLEFTLT